MSAPRKMRRMRDVAAPEDGLLSSYELYQLQGDVNAALEALTQSNASTYNRKILTFLRAPNDDLLPDGLDLYDGKDTVLGVRKKRRNELVAIYNRALILFTQGNAHEAARLCTEQWTLLHEQTTSTLPKELIEVSSRVAFLLLECLLLFTAGMIDTASADVPPAESILDWLDGLDAERDPQFKFLLHLYKSRVDLAYIIDNKHSDAKIRSSRKELKQAMDVFQHKLRASFGAETGSVVSSNNSEENMSLPYEPQASTPSSIVLQKHNQSGLSLKANSEQLKGNTKKSLILCNEALTAAAEDPSYIAVHENNLAVVYETIGRRHLALHALSKSLRAKSDDISFYSDGTARPDHTLLVLHNTAICALQARHFQSAYECMATAVSRSRIFSERPRCWLRMAEACIGMFAEQTNRTTTFSAVEANGEPKGVIIDNAMLTDHPKVEAEAVAALLATPEDLEQVKRSPLLRARASLEQALQMPDKLSAVDMTAARLTLSYVHLAFHEYTEALKMAQLVLDSQTLPETADSVTIRTHKRRLATARMYAAEASCLSGDSTAAMKFLVGDGQDDAFDRLASDLSGVTLEMAASNPGGTGKRRLARAQTVVRSSASAITADMGNLTAAKQLAMSAQAMEDAYASNRERSVARRALIYTLLREGHEGPALSLLRSLR